MTYRVLKHIILNVIKMGSGFLFLLRRLTRYYLVLCGVAFSLRVFRASAIAFWGNILMYKDVFNDWLNYKSLTADDAAELNSIKDDEKQIEYRFGKNLEFGTAGMRGIIGLGTNMMNVYTVRKASQGVADYVKTLGKKALKHGVVISYDTRRQSYDFAYNAAVVLVSNGVRAYLFPKEHPVPMLSFATRKLKASAGIMITASHNPKEYNGFKVYGSDGAQMDPAATEKVVAFIDAIGSPLSDKIKFDESVSKRIILVPKKLDKSYYSTILKLALSKKEVRQAGKSLKLVYTPLHGSGYIPVTTVLKKMGINVFIVPEQTAPDSAFSTVAVPNPEHKETLMLAIKMADLKEADVVFGTDPDCDRLGVAIRTAPKEFTSLSGNQVGALLVDYVLRRLKETGKLNPKGFGVKSFVTTSLARLIANDYGVELFDVPVGFKYIGEKIRELDDSGKRKFLFGFEESCGYLRGTHARDKDAVVASMLFAEMVCYYSAHGIGVYERLQQLYDKYGFVFDVTESTVFEGLNAMLDMEGVVDKIKTIPVERLGGINVVATRDYSTLIRKAADGDEQPIDCARCNAVYFELAGGGFVCVRPSGTEPKLKVYYSLPAENEVKAKMLFKKVKSDFEKLFR